jgi:hypothetical protein
MSKSLSRLVFSLCLLAVILVLGAPKSANACPRAVTIKYYGWVEPSNPGGYSWCTLPAIGPAPIVGVTVVWQQIGQETTDCDGNYSSWGGPCMSGGGTSANEVTTSTACTCGS